MIFIMFLLILAILLCSGSSRRTPLSSGGIIVTRGGQPDWIKNPPLPEGIIKKDGKIYKEKASGELVLLKMKTVSFKEFFGHDSLR